MLRLREWKLVFSATNNLHFFNLEYTYVKIRQKWLVLVSHLELLNFGRKGRKGLKCQLCTGGPHNSPTFYLRIRLFAVCEYRQRSLFAGVTFQENTANTKTANSKSNNDQKTGVPFPFSLKKYKIYKQAQFVIKYIVFN